MKKNKIQYRYSEQKYYKFKMILIYNDLYQIFCYLRQPFLKLGNKTAQQITNIPVFLSFFVLFCGALQISFDTQNTSILKNYPLLIDLIEPKIPQTFETFALQISNTKKAKFQIYQKYVEKAYKKVAQQQSEEQKRFIDFYKYLNYDKYTYPSIFENIPIPSQQQNTINLYKTFEQFGTLLSSELQKEEEQEDLIYQQTMENATIDLIGNKPYYVWSSETKNYDPEISRKQTNWQVDPSEIIIKDLKKNNTLDMSYNIVKEFVNNYQDFMKQNEETIFIKNQILPFQKVKIAQNLKKIFLKSTNPIINSWNEILSIIEIPPLHEELNSIECFEIISKQIDEKVAGKNLPKDQLLQLKKYLTNEFDKFINSKNTKSEAVIQKNDKLERWLCLIQEGLDLTSGLFFNQYWVSDSQNRLNFGKELETQKPEIPEYSLPEIHKVLKDALQIRQKYVIDSSTNPRNYYNKYIEEYLEMLNKELPDQPSEDPRPNSVEETIKIFEEMSYQVEKIKDLIPRKLQGFYPDIVEDSNDSVFNINKYEEPEYKILSYKKADWDSFEQQLSTFVATNPPFMDLYHKHINNINEKSLHNIKFDVEPLYETEDSIIKNDKFIELLTKFFELIQNKNDYYKKIYNHLKKRELLMLGGYINLEIQEIQDELTEQIQYDVQLFKPETYKTYEQYDAAVKEYYKRATFEKISFRPKPIFLYLEDYTVFYIRKTPHGDQYDFLDLETHLDFINWSQKQKIKNYDHYLNRVSNIVKMKNKNPYLEKIILPEDYLLESILFFINRNWNEIENQLLKQQKKEMLRDSDTELETIEQENLYSSDEDNNEFINFVDMEESQEETDEEAEAVDLYLNLSSNIFNEKFQNKPFPSVVTSSVLDFFKKRKIQRMGILKKFNQLLHLQYLLNEKKNIQTSFLYNSIFQHNFFEIEPKLSTNNCDLQIITPNLFNKKYIFNLNTISVSNPIIDFLSNHVPNKYFETPFFKKDEIQISNQQEPLLNNPTTIQKNLNFKKLFTISPILKKMENMIQVRNPTFMAENNGYKIVFEQFWINFLRHINIKVPFKSDIYDGNWKFQLLWFPKKFNLSNLQIKNLKPNFTPYKDKKFLNFSEAFCENLTQPSNQVALLSSYSFWEINLQKELIYQKVKQLREWDENKIYFVQKLPSVPKKLNDFDIFFNTSMENEPYPLLIRNNLTVEMQEKVQHTLNMLSIFKEAYNYNDLGDLYDSFKTQMNLQDFYSFEETIDSILEDFYNEYKVFLNKKDLEQPIYQTQLVRTMSGYLFPDIDPILLSKISNKKFYTIEIEIPLYNLNRNLFFELKNSNLETPAIQTSIRSFKHQQKISKHSFFNKQFFEIRENFNRYSWSILLFFSGGWVFVNVFKNVYKKYAKEIVESCIDFLNRVGILDDVQWVKEELGMTPVDKGYRGIRHQGKKIKNIIGINRKHVIIEVSEMIWFLKTKKLLKSTSLDPFIQLILLFQYHLTTIQIQQLTQRNKLLVQASTVPKPLYTLDFTEYLERLRIKEQHKSKQKLRPFQPPEQISTDIKKPDLSKLSLDNFKFLPLEFQQNQQYLKPKGFLFTGPPGTGKTLLVQAIAGETGVPVVTQSGGLLQNPRLRGRGAKTLHKLFLRAREIAPCIIFIDEIDGIGTRRQFLPLNVDIHGRYDPVEWLESEGIEIPPQAFQSKLQRRPEFFDDHDPFWEEPEFTQRIQTTRIPIDVLQDMQSSRGARSEQLSILTQLLIELDGIHLLESIVVIGATNRLEILDPALMRPGRFQRILNFNLPDYPARINLFKLYTQSSKIGIENISWDYFAKRTHGLSSADIASIVFASELTAVRQFKKHTFETLERGIDLITSFPTDPVIFRLKKIFIFLQNSTQIFLEKNYLYQKAVLHNTAIFKVNESKLKETSNVLRTCYYNIGKLIVLFGLQVLPFSSAYMTLWERPKNFRFFFFTKNFNEFDEFDKQMLSRQEIEKRLLAFFGGKAAESLLIFLPINKFSAEIYFQLDSNFICLANSLEQSNFGLDNEIQMAQSLLKLMIEKWYFYLERIATEKFHPILENVNLWEYVEYEKDMLFGQAFTEEIEINLDMRNRLSKNEQKYSYQAWWMKKIATQLNYNEKSFLQWSRIYLSDPDNSAQNIEWVPPDEYFHTIPRIPPYCMSWAQFLENGRFALSNLLLLQAFNTVFKTLRQFSEFMDFLADHFLRYECIRETEFRSKIRQFFNYYLKNIHRS